MGSGVLAKSAEPQPFRPTETQTVFLVFESAPIEIGQIEPQKTHFPSLFIPLKLPV